MSAILYLPGIVVILFRRKGILDLLRYLSTILAVQVMVAMPFINEDGWAYFQTAFDLGRVFLYKWTVNWRFLSEETFLSSSWATGLLIGHASVLIAFGVFRWSQPDGGVWSLVSRGLRQPGRPPALTPVTADCKLSLQFL